MNQKLLLKAIIGLGNPGPKFYNTRHNIGFRVLEELATKYQGTFKSVNDMEIAPINLNGHDVLLIMPQTFMNASGKVIPYLTKKQIKAENILVIHDELELPLGKLKFKTGGSAKGHNGLKSLIEYCGPDFHRIAVGISRPANKEEVPDYVLGNFKQSDDIQSVIQEAITLIESL